MAAVESWSEVAERVRAARMACGLTQGDLARRIGIDRTALVRIEAGERGVSALELTRLATVLDVPVAYFVSRSPGPVAAYRSAVAEASEAASDVGADRSRFLLDVELEKHARDAEWLRSEGFIAAVPDVPERAVAARDDAVELARLARHRLAVGLEPLGPLAATAERFGLYVRVVPRSTAGASLQIEPGFGVAVVGGEAEPGRRRWTAAHELGHHLLGDKYNSHAGVAAGDQEREALADAFASELLLPAEVLLRADWVRPLDEVRRQLVELAGTYRISWTAAVNSARQLALLSSRDKQRLSAAIPGRGDFMEVLGYEPARDLESGSTGPLWRRAALSAWRASLITAQRTVDLLGGALAAEDLPDLDPGGAVV